MSLKPREEIGLETHSDISQFIRVERGKAKVVVGKSRYLLKKDDAVIIPAGQPHNVINVSKTASLKLYTLYSGQEHQPGTVQMNKPL